MVPMMDGEFPQVFAVELTRAPTANPGVHLERSIAVSTEPHVPFTQSLCNNLVKLFR
jgi:hypothetical protein